LAVVLAFAAGNTSACVVGGSAERVVLSALQDAAGLIGETEGLGRWPAVSVVTAGMWLGSFRVANAPGSRVFSAAPEKRLMTLIDPNDRERPP
jgi:hypothetical protein